MCFIIFPKNVVIREMLWSSSDCYSEFWSVTISIRHVFIPYSKLTTTQWIKVNVNLLDGKSLLPDARKCVLVGQLHCELHVASLEFDIHFTWCSSFSRQPDRVRNSGEMRKFSFSFEAEEEVVCHRLRVD